MNMDQAQFIIRAPHSKDVPFILNSWLRSYRTADAVKLLDNETYYRNHHPLFTRLLETCEVRIACADDDRDQILGYAVSTNLGNAKVLVYCYTKFLFRGMGIARKLLISAGINAEEPFFYTFLSKTGDRQRKKFPRALYNNFLVADLIKGAA